MAEDLGAGDHVSLNLSRTAAGAHLRPCEMPAQRVADFVLALVAEQTPSRT